MKKPAYFSIVLTVIYILTSHAFASANEWKIDPAHSGIYFRAKHIYSATNGYFNKFEGDITFNPANLDESGFNFKVKVKSINTNDSKRDNHLLSGDFFNAKKYPEMTFKSKTIKHVKGDQYTVEGVMTVKNVSKTIEVPFTFFGSKQHPFKPKVMVAGFEARITIDRLAYQVGVGKFYKMGVVGKDVDVLISLEATR